MREAARLGIKKNEVF